MRYLWLIVLLVACRDSTGVSTADLRVQVRCAQPPDFAACVGVFEATLHDTATGAVVSHAGPELAPGDLLIRAPLGVYAIGYRMNPDGMTRPDVVSAPSCCVEVPGVLGINF